MADPRRCGTWVFWATIACVLPLVAAVCYTQAAKNDYDFHHFYRDASYTWQHGALNPDHDNRDPLLRRQLPFYLPVVSLALSPMAAGGLASAAVLWTLGQIVAAFVCMRVLWSWRRPEPWAAGAFVLTWALVLPVVYESSRFNQLGLVVLALVLVGVCWVQRRRPVMGAAALAIASVLKLLPALLVVWLVLKRQWRAACAFVVACGVLAIVPCLLWFGPGATWEYHRQWFQNNVAGAPMRGMTDGDLRHHFIDHRNQSLSAVIARLSDPDHPYPVPYQPWRLEPGTARGIARAGWLLLAGALIWATRKPRARAGSDAADAHYDTSLYLLGLLLLSPLLRTYYLVWAIPALHVLARTALRSTAGCGRLPARIALTIWIAGMVGWASVPARYYGVHLWMLIAIAVLVVIVRARQREAFASDASENDAGVMAAKPE
jgi:alpha-1,2-mannosyltransferase